MGPNYANAYQKNAILTASPAELTLMLYDGIVKFCNKAKVAMEKNDYEGRNTNIKKAQAIVAELRSTLDKKYPVWEDFERVYTYIYDQLLEANIHNNPEALEQALVRTREMRETWKEVMGKKKA